ncbi:MAG: right-handed parallel beta-helix repeat-containing protein, partial [Lentisphaeria bacterium]|nr:right-handed parallel beta-helix repeat-containing protein [Lentisphaeria bacterium]
IRNGKASSGAGVYKRNKRDLYLSNCVIHANSSSGSGGGVYKTGSASAMYMQNCIVSNNISDTTGGGIYANSARLTALNCEVVDNVSISGGGGLYAISATDEPGMIFEMHACRIERNKCNTDSGGGFYVYARDGSTGIIANCEILCNQAGLGGGGIMHRYYAGGGDLIVSNSIIRGNTSAYNSSYAGGGIRINSPGIIVGCLIVGNRASAVSGGSGGLALEQSGRFRVENTTIASNIAAMNGGGMVINANVTTNMVVRNTIIYGNSAAVSGRSNIYLVAGTGVILTNCCVAPMQNGSDQPVMPDAGNRTDNPMFAGMESGNFRLLHNSPYVNTAANMPWMADANDLDGHHRIDRFSGRADVGCYEYIPKGMLFKAK